MPYMEYLRCEKCGLESPLDLDSIATINSYIADGRKGAIDMDNVVKTNDYLIYVCSLCNGHFRYTFKDVEERVREFFSKYSNRYLKYIRDTKTPDKDVPLQQQIRDSINERVRRIYSSPVNDI